MGNSKWYDGEEVSTIPDKGKLPFIDYDNDKSVRSYNPEAEGPIIISIPFPFVNDKPQSVLLGDIVNDKITITNTTAEAVSIWSIDIYDSIPKESFTLSIEEPPSENSDEEYVKGFLDFYNLGHRGVQAHQTLTVWLSCKPKGAGLHQTAVHIDTGVKTIERLVFIVVDDKISRSLVSNKPYVRDRSKKRLVENISATNTYVPTARPVREHYRGYKFRLNDYPIIDEVRAAVLSKQVPVVLGNELTRVNYRAYFRTLLNIEEITLEEEMKGYDMEGVAFGKRGPYLTLQVPGLAEKRPSLVYGDFVFAKILLDDPYDETPPYQGYIHRVEAEEVYLEFDKKFHSRYSSRLLCNVQFNYNRVNMRKLYQAIEATEQLDPEFLFPAQSPYNRCIIPTQYRPLSTTLNEEQKLAIKKILGCKGGHPYIIHGPPGTGKTLTIVETIIQLYRGRRNAKLLVCAPSNNAADNILEMLLKKLGEVDHIYDILRLNATTRFTGDIKREYQRYCYIERDNFACPEIKALLRYRVIISTYMNAFSLYAEDLRRGYFTHIFLDEAAQASEPETMVPLSNLIGWGTVVVLAGDPCQLGPVIHSKDAESSGLSISFLERLFDCDFYRSGNDNYVTMLVRNYRCHPEILLLPSQLFYDEELIALKTEDPSASKWANLLPNKDFPVLFLGIQGCDERQGNNPSWFNRIEISKIVEIVTELLDKGLSGEDIGVVTPYRQQVVKVSDTLEALGYQGIKVGSVEQFQGQERTVIIISTVRSTIKYNEFDKIHYLGFLSNWRRFNVAITRASSLLIIIGNPHIIGKDKYWNMLLWRCVDNGSYEGCPLPEREALLEECPQEDGNRDYQEGPTGGGWGDSAYSNNIPQVTNDNGWGGESNVYNDVGWGGENKSYNDDGWGGWSNEKYNPEGSNYGGWGDSSYHNNIPQVSYDEGRGGESKVYTDDGWGGGVGLGDQSNKSDIPESSNNGRWGGSPYDDDIPQVSNEDGWSGEANLYNDDTPWV